MAAGKGTRLKSQLPKVLHEVGGKPLLAHVIRAAQCMLCPPKMYYAIIGHEADRVRAAMEHTGINFVLQTPSSAAPATPSWWRARRWPDTTTSSCSPAMRQ